MSIILKKLNKNPEMLFKRKGEEEYPKTAGERRPNEDGFFPALTV